MEGGEPTLKVIVNASAGAPGRDSAAVIADALAREGVRADIRVVSPGEVQGAVLAAVRALGAEQAVVAVAGGDGTLSAAAAALAGTGAALAPFPLGTRNHFARRLGIASPADAARAAVQGCRTVIPVGSVNGRTFINHASAGLYPHGVRIRERLRRWTGKSAGNALAAVAVLVRLRTNTLVLEVGGVAREMTVPGLWVGLGAGSFRLPVDGVPPEGGQLEVVVPRTRTRTGLLIRGLRALWYLRRAEPLHRAGWDVYHAPAFKLQSHHDIDVSRDGEVERLRPPLEFRIHRDALAVVKPPDRPR